MSSFPFNISVTILLLKKMKRKGNPRSARQRATLSKSRSMKVNAR
jgi:hypothetical protein